jgi:hypothetical protein
MGRESVLVLDAEIVPFQALHITDQDQAAYCFLNKKEVFELHDMLVFFGVAKLRAVRGHHRRSVFLHNGIGPPP